MPPLPTGEKLASGGEAKVVESIGAGGAGSGGAAGAGGAGGGAGSPATPANPADSPGWDEFASAHPALAGGIEKLMDLVESDPAAATKRFATFFSEEGAAPSKPGSPATQATKVEAPPAPGETDFRKSVSELFGGDGSVEEIRGLVTKVREHREGAELEESRKLLVGKASTALQNSGNPVFSNEKIRGIVAEAVASRMIHGQRLEEAVPAAVKEFASGLDESFVSLVQSKGEEGTRLVMAGGVAPAPPKVDWSKMDESQALGTFADQMVKWFQGLRTPE